MALVGRFPGRSTVRRPGFRYAQVNGRFSTGKRDFHPKHAECTENRVFHRKSRFSPKTRRMHRKSSFPSENEIFTQNTQNAPKIEFSIGNRDFHPKHAECTENRVFHRKTRFSPKTRRMHRKSSFPSEIEIFTQNTDLASRIVPETAEHSTRPSFPLMTCPGPFSNPKETKENHGNPRKTE